MLDRVLLLHGNPTFHVLYPHLEGRRIVLASQSPRRRELMGMLGLDVECMARDVDESWPQELEGVEVAAFVANKKADAYLDVLGTLAMSSSPETPWSSSMARSWKSRPTRPMPVRCCAP